jgi:hypothetical protein
MRVSGEPVGTSGRHGERARLMKAPLRKMLAQEIGARSAMARGVVVLDASVTGLAPALREANILVVAVPAGTEKEEIKSLYLPHRILLTGNPRAFLEDAPIYEYGIVSLAKLKSIDADRSYTRNRTARLVSKSLSTYGLWAKGAKFLLELRDDGRHRLKKLE